MRQLLSASALLLSSIFLSCVADSASNSGLLVQRDTLSNGVIQVRYPGTLGQKVFTATPELRLGAVEGDPNLVFGDVRGVDADQNGRIFVLDYLASEIRAFDSSGVFLHTVASKGEGPGELSRANGLILVGDTILWVQDHAKWMMIGLSPEGEELTRLPMHVLSYGFIWTGTVDNASRLWKADSHFDQEDTYEPREGLNEVTVRLFLNSLDMSTSEVDSVYLGDDSALTFVQKVGNGRWHLGIPFHPNRITTVDPDGGFWQVHPSAYRVARLDGVGDTTLVLEVDVDPLPVEPADRNAFLDRISERGPNFQKTAEEVADLIPGTKPLIQKLIVDDEGRLWVERTVRDGAERRFDVFNRAGEFLGSVELSFNPDQYRPIRIRHGHIYAVVLDEWDVPSIVRAQVPEGVGGQDIGS